MATPDQIPSDLTLEIGERLSPERFVAAVRAFFGYVDEIGQAVAPDGAAPDWVVQVREGSALIGVDPGPQANIVTVRQVYARIEQGIRHLLAGEYGGDNFPEAAVRHLKVLSEIGSQIHGTYIPLTLWVNRTPHVIGAAIADAMQEDWRSDYSDYGTIEGRFETIQGDGGLQFRVRDAMLRQLVPCRVPEHLLATVIENFRNRVEVSGAIHYGKNGVPLNITVESIEALPDDDSLPSIEDARGILRTPV
jgi:hypothetical protein